MMVTDEAVEVMGTDCFLYRTELFLCWGKGAFHPFDLYFCKRSLNLSARNPDSDPVKKCAVRALSHAFLCGIARS